jgi:hypothetical protein
MVKKYKEFIKQTNLLMYYFYNIKEQHRLIYNLIQLEDVLKTDTFFDLKRKKQLKEELININNKKNKFEKLFYDFSLIEK